MLAAVAVGGVELRVFFLFIFFSQAAGDNPGSIADFTGFSTPVLVSLFRCLSTQAAACIIVWFTCVSVSGVPAAPVPEDGRHVSWTGHTVRRWIVAHQRGRGRHPGSFPCKCQLFQYVCNDHDIDAYLFLLLIVSANSYNGLHFLLTVLFRGCGSVLPAFAVMMPVLVVHYCLNNCVCEWKKTLLLLFFNNFQAEKKKKWCSRWQEKPLL